jgi:hypothetical protein
MVEPTAHARTWFSQYSSDGRAYSVYAVCSDLSLIPLFTTYMVYSILFLVGILEGD